MLWRGYFHGFVEPNLSLFFRTNVGLLNHRFVIFHYLLLRFLKELINLIRRGLPFFLKRILLVDQIANLLILCLFNNYCTAFIFNFASVLCTKFTFLICRFLDYIFDNWLITSRDWKIFFWASSFFGGQFKVLMHRANAWVQSIFRFFLTIRLQLSGLTLFNFMLSGAGLSVELI